MTEKGLLTTLQLTQSEPDFMPALRLPRRNQGRRCSTAQTPFRTTAEQNSRGEEPRRGSSRRAALPQRPAPAARRAASHRAALIVPLVTAVPSHRHPRRYCRWHARGCQHESELCNKSRRTIENTASQGKTNETRTRSVITQGSNARC